MKILAPLLVLLVGCSPAAPALSLHERARLGAWLALHVSKEEPAQKVPSPDKPDGGDVCEDCGGTGKLPGDGVIHPTCSTCNGTGRKPAGDFDPPAEREALEAAMLKAEAVDRADREMKAAAKKAPPPPPAPAVERYAVPPSDGRVYRKVCRDGKCSWEPVK